MTQCPTFILICGLLAATFICPTPRVHAAQQEAELAGRVVRMEVKTENFDDVGWPAEQVTLAVETVVVKPGDRMFRLLEQRGIRSDTEALTLIYDLNPALEKVEPLVPGTSLSLPKVTGGAQLRQLLQRGNVVALIVDPRTKERFAENARSIGELSKGFATLAAARFANQDKRAETVAQVQNLAAWFEHIRKSFGRRTAKPLRQAALHQIHDEAEVLNSILAQAQAPGKHLNASDQAQISLIHADIKQAIEKWDETMSGGLPPADAQYKVVVEFIGGNAERIRNLRVYYVQWGLFRTPLTNPPVRSRNFHGLGPDSTATLPTKDYKVWAAPDGNPLTPVTPPADLYVRKPQTGDVIKLTLSLNP